MSELEMSDLYLFDWSHLFTGSPFFNQTVAQPSTNQFCLATVWSCFDIMFVEMLLWRRVTAIYRPLGREGGYPLPPLGGSLWS